MIPVRRVFLCDTAKCNADKGFRRRMYLFLVDFFVR